MLDKHMDEYEQSGMGAKVKLSAYIVHIMKEERRRCLKERKDGGWPEVAEATARAKVSFVFHSRRVSVSSDP
jgi:hypothetical protein